MVCANPRSVRTACLARPIAEANKTANRTTSIVVAMERAKTRSAVLMGDAAAADFSARTYQPRRHAAATAFVKGLRMRSVAPLTAARPAWTTRIALTPTTAPPMSAWPTARVSTHPSPVDRTTAAAGRDAMPTTIRIAPRVCRKTVPAPPTAIAARISALTIVAAGRSSGSRALSMASGTSRSRGLQPARTFACSDALTVIKSA